MDQDYSKSLRNHMRISKTKLSAYAALDRKKMRDRSGLFRAEGVKCVEELLKRFDIESIVCCGGDVVRRFAEKTDIRLVLEADESEIRKLSSLSTPSTVVGIFRMDNEFRNLAEIAAEDSPALLLDGIQDPGNLGTIIRTCDWFGIRHIFASRETADFYNPKVVQSTMGSLARTDIIYCDLVELVRLYGDNKRIFGTFMEGSSIYHTDFGRSPWIVMGNEGNGISERLTRLINERITIPPTDLYSCPESLNVGIATAITLSVFRNPNR